MHVHTWSKSSGPSSPKEALPFFRNLEGMSILRMLQCMHYIDKRSYQSIMTFKQEDRRQEAYKTPSPRMQIRDALVRVLTCSFLNYIIVNARPSSHLPYSL